MSASAIYLPLPRRPVAVLVLIGAVALALRAAFAVRLDLFPDEMLYAWLWHVAPLNFCPHPPGTPLLAGMGMAIAGRTGFGVRLFPLLLGCTAPALAYILGRTIAGAAVAFWSALFCLAAPMIFGFGAILTPDGTQLIFWAAALLLAWRALGTGSTAAWAAAGAVVGAGLYVKYMMVLFFPSLLLCLVAVPAWRRHLRTPGPWVCGLVAVLVFAPVAVWTDYRLGWPTLRYHLVSRQRGMAPSLMNVLEYHGGHLGYYSPLLYAGMVAALAVAVYRGVRRGEKDMAFLGFFGGFMWLFFAAIALVTRRELSREQWDAPAYMPAMVALAILAGRWIARAPDLGARRRRVRLLVGAPVLGFLTMAVVMTETLTGTFTAAAGKDELFRNLSGWRAMAARADAEFARLPPGKPAFLLSNEFSGALAYWFYGRATPRVYTLDHATNRQYGLQQLFSDHGMAEEHLAREMGNPAVYVYESGSRKTTPEGRRERLRRWFDEPVIPDDGGREGRFLILRATGFHGTDKSTTGTAKDR